MSDPLIGEIQAFGFNFGTSGINNGTWLPCDGRSMQIRENTALYSLIGVLYGGDAQNFNLPNFNGRVGASQGAGPGLTPRSVGETFGAPTQTLSLQEMPAHQHTLQLGAGTATGATPGPGAAGSTMLIDPRIATFAAIPPPADTTLSANAIAYKGQDQAHENSQPTLTMYYCICVAGIYPSFD